MVLAVRPFGYSEALAGLWIGSDFVVVSVIAGVGIGELRGVIGTGAPVVRAIPLPAVRERRSVTVAYPSHPVVDAFFDRLGEALPVADEAHSSVFSTLTGTLTTHYWYLATITDWALPAEHSRRVRGPLPPQSLPGRRALVGRRQALSASARG